MGTAVALLIAAAVASVVARIDWNQLTQPLVSLLLMIGVLYWLTTLLPGPIKKVGRAAGKQVATAVKKRRQRH